MSAPEDGVNISMPSAASSRSSARRKTGCARVHRRSQQGPFAGRDTQRRQRDRRCRQGRHSRRRPAWYRFPCRTHEGCRRRRCCIILMTFLIWNAPLSAIYLAPRCQTCFALIDRFQAMSDRSGPVIVAQNVLGVFPKCWRRCSIRYRRFG